MINEKLYTVSEVCEILHRNKRTIYNYVKSGQLRASKPGGKNLLIAESDLNEFIQAGVNAGYYQALYPRPHKKDITSQ